MLKTSKIITTTLKSNLTLTTQDSTNDKYFKLYKIDTELINKDIDTLQNTLSFQHSNDEIFFGLDMGVYETLKNGYNDKYEYIYPELTFDKNIFRPDIRFSKLWYKYKGSYLWY